jgi:uncharacterized protein YbgA (DUF1722 family)/uncharacterized protein YbbK (DUF523 family)
VKKFAVPIVVVSKCLGFEACRYNGAMISDDFVAKLRPHVQFVPVCPELEIELGVPRDPIRVVSQGDELRLIQPETGRDVTNAMNDFSNSFLSSLSGVDGFVLKSRSPSCGIKDVKIYPRAGTSGPVSKGAGFFGGAVVDIFPHLAVEDEGRLTNVRIREHFLTKLFTTARFRMLQSSVVMRDLVQFHSENKLLLMAYNQKELRLIGRIVANHDRKPLDEVLADYERHLYRAFARAPRCTSNINVLMHALGYFSEELSSDEKSFFLDLLEQYRAGKIPLSVNVNLVKSFIVRIGEPYLAQQTFFGPFPQELIDLSDSGKHIPCGQDRRSIV